MVATGVAAECTATLAIFPGDPAFRSVSLRDGAGAALYPTRWAALIDLSLAAAGERYALTGGLPSVARHGHFMSPEHLWEQVGF